MENETSFWKRNQLSVVLLIGGLLLLVLLKTQLGTGPHPLEGREAPVFTARILDGGTLDLTSHRNTRVVVLDFFATWCPPCREGLPVMAALAKEYKGRAAVYAVNLRESPQEVRAFLEQEGITIPVAIDSGRIADLYRVSAIPQTVIIGKNGFIRKVHVGLPRNPYDTFKAGIDAVLASASPE